MSEHIVSPRVYAVIFLSLMLGTGITVWAAFQDFGKYNIVIALAIATIKATLVVLIFMHVKYTSEKLTKMVIVTAMFWLLILLALSMADYGTRLWP